MRTLRRELPDDEEVLVSSRSSAWTLFLPGLITGCIIGAVIYGLLSWHHAFPWARDAAIAVCGASALYLAEKVMAWRARVFLVTDRRIVTAEGLLRRHGREVRLDAVQEVHFDQRLSERMRGRGILQVTGSSGEALAPFYDVRRPRRVQAAISDAIGRVRNPAPTGTGAEVTGATDDAQLEELHRRGVITEHEYREQSAKLRDA